MSDQKLGQVLEKPCVCSGGHIFSPIIMKLGENVCPNEIWNKFENGSCQVKIWVTRSNLRKPCVGSRSHIFSLISMKRDQNVCLEISDEFENRSCGV